MAYYPSCQNPFDFRPDHSPVPPERPDRYPVQPDRPDCSYWPQDRPEQKPGFERQPDGSSVQQDCPKRPQCGEDFPVARPMKNVEFPPLSEQPVPKNVTMPACNPVDSLELEKSTPVPPGHEDCKVEKDLDQALPQTECMVAYGLKQVRHAIAITLELKLLLEHEQKILQQVMTRIDKFKALRDENRRKSSEWESSYKEKIPEYDAFLKKLVNVRTSQVITAENLPGPVQQKILFQIVSRTTNTANRVVVQLSLEKAVANDIDSTLQDLKNHCTVMLKQIRGWLRMVTNQECNQNIILDRWLEIKETIKTMKEKAESTSSGKEQSTSMAIQMKPYEERLKRVEAAICKLCGTSSGTCETEKKPDKKCVKKPDTQATKCFECCPPAIDRVRSPKSPESPGVSPDPFTPCSTNTGGYIEDSYINRNDFLSPCPGDQWPPQPQSPPCLGEQWAPQPQLPCCPEEEWSPQPQSPTCPGGERRPPQPQVCQPQVCQPQECQPQVCQPQDICPPGSPPNYFGISMTVQSDGCSPNMIPECASPEEYDDLGALRRGRAPRGMFPGIELVDTPGMGYPVPLAALERGGRQMGQCAPMTPPSPQPRNIGRFRPLATSSAVGRGPGALRQRMATCPQPSCSPTNEPLDPALLPKIQCDLKKLEERNRQLQCLLSNFKQIRAKLTDEISKAVCLNQKLQRDLFYVAESRRK